MSKDKHDSHNCQHSHEHHHDHNCAHHGHHHNDHDCAHHGHHHPKIETLETGALFSSLLSILEKKNSIDLSKKLYEEVLNLCKEKELSHELAHVRIEIEKRLAEIKNNSLKSKLTHF